ncbi:MAG: hypothetical protein KDH97_10040, partial [Calditrichaeota bacterium]|nr:hypothetical protein [Calditrichota bacterium]
MKNLTILTICFCLIAALTLPGYSADPQGKKKKKRSNVVIIDDEHTGDIVIDMKELNKAMEELEVELENLDLNIDLSDLDDLQADLDELHLDDLDFDFRG